MLYKVVLTFKSVDETLVCDHSNKSYQSMQLCGTVYYATYDVVLISFLCLYSKTLNNEWIIKEIILM